MKNDTQISHSNRLLTKQPLFIIPQNSKQFKEIIQLTTSTRNSYPLQHEINEPKINIKHHQISSNSKLKQKKFPFEIFSAGPAGKRKALAPPPEEQPNSPNLKYNIYSCRRNIGKNFIHRISSIPRLIEQKINLSNEKSDDISVNFPEIKNRFSDPYKYHSNNGTPEKIELFSTKLNFAESTRGNFSSSQISNLELLIHKHTNSMENTCESLPFTKKAQKPVLSAAGNKPKKLAPISKPLIVIMKNEICENPFIKTGYFASCKSKMGDYKDTKKHEIKILDKKRKIKETDDSFANITFGSGNTVDK